MRRVTAVLSAAVIALSAVSVLAQAKPDFSGTWTLVPPADGGGGGGGRGGGRGGGGGGWGMSPTIKQTGSTLVVTYTAGRGGGEAQPVTVTYNIGGAPTKRSMMGRGGEATEVTDTATWSGNSLVIVTKTATAEQRRTISLKDGNLVIEYNSGREGATPQTITYKKG